MPKCARIGTDAWPGRVAVPGQVRPELVKVVPPAALSKLQSQTTCLEAGPFSPTDLPTVDALARSAGLAMTRSLHRMTRPLTEADAVDPPVRASTPPGAARAASSASCAAGTVSSR